MIFSKNSVKFSNEKFRSKKKDFHLIAVPFYRKDEIENSKDFQNFTLLKTSIIDWGKEEYYRRVFDKFIATKLKIYLVKDENPLYEDTYLSRLKIINKNLDKFKFLNCNEIFITKNPNQFLKVFTLIYGFGISIKLDNLPENLNTLKAPLGQEGWKDFEEFIKFANISCDWIVLRNFEYLPHNFFGNDKDIDILCSDKKEFANNLNLSKRSWGVSSYKTLISGIEIPVDLRYLGDSYYDKLWESNILRNKFIYKNLIPVPSDIDYFFSLLYHAKLQKTKIKNKYIRVLNKLGLKLNLFNRKESIFNNNKSLAILLSKFMNLNNYEITKPIDREVRFNKSFQNIIIRYLKKRDISKPPLKIRFIYSIPFPLRLTLVNFKNLIVNSISLKK